MGAVCLLVILGIICDSDLPEPERNSILSWRGDGGLMSIPSFSEFDSAMGTNLGTSCVTQYFVQKRYLKPNPYKSQVLLFFSYQIHIRVWAVIDSLGEDIIGRKPSVDKLYWKKKKLVLSTLSWVSPIHFN